MGYSFVDLVTNDRETPMVEFLRKQGVKFDPKNKDHLSYHLKSGGFMDLVVEIFYMGDEWQMSVCHYFEQNGDLMRDPEILYRLIDYKTDGTQIFEDAKFIQQDPVGSYSEVYPVMDGKEMINKKLKAELQDFTKMWVRNLKFQGHKLEIEVQ